MFVVDRLAGLLRAPSLEWDRIADDPRPVEALVVTALTASIAAAGLQALVPAGAQAWTGQAYLAFYAAAALHVATSVVLIMLLGRMLQGRADLARAIALVGCAGPAFWLGVGLTSWNGWLAALLFLYATYQLFVGLPRVLKTPEAAVAALRILVFFALVASALTAAMQVREALTAEPPEANYSTAPR